MNQIKSAALAYQQIPEYMKENTSAISPTTVRELEQKFAHIGASAQLIRDVIRKHAKLGSVGKARAGIECEYWWKTKTEVHGQAPAVVQAEPDMVNRPPHYTSGGIETIDYMKAKMSPEEYRGFLKGNAIKYLSRAEMKGGSEDYKKAQWYINKLVEV